MISWTFDEFGVEFFLPDLITIVMFDRPPLCQYDYSFRTEHSAAARLPPSPTRTSLSSEAWGSSPNISQTTLSPMEPSRRDLYTTTEDLHTTNSPKHMYWEEKKKTDSVGLTETILTLTSGLWEGIYSPEEKWREISLIWFKNTFVFPNSLERCSL